ncbi:membrane protein [Flexivirga endophytica]|uniref:Membrane protein n=1 Tax=Flexivirga endophytica TaxID=1849103 RepID=A0A916WV44_9MICO|nr:YcnI family protein [Flexivirga endophytica]GGB32473.1 membrane protein [Flexivirga endophytica]GHB53327.1 membrane protein [Flexivirga endophytica]
MTTTPRAPVRRTAATLATAGLLLAVPVAAQAHVRVSPDTAEAGSYATLVFRVPTEKADASTTKVEVDLPTKHPFTSASYQPVPGWTAKITTSKLPKPVKTDDGTITEAPTKIVWTASKDAAIKPGEFQQFPVSLGVVPDVPSVSFAAIQTYSDGSVVKWDEPTKPGAEEPEHPAPMLTVGAASASAAPSAASSDAPSVAAAPESDNSSSDDSSNSGVWFGVGGLAVAVVALLVALYAVTRRSR